MLNPNQTFFYSVCECMDDPYNSKKYCKKTHGKIVYSNISRTIIPYKSCKTLTCTIVCGLSELD